MKGPTGRERQTASDNTISPSPQKAATERSKIKGDVPISLLDRYLIERDRQGRPESFYRDHRATDPMFRDEGRKLVTRQAYPDAVSDMMKIARHRGWNQVRVSGDEGFRREAWIQGRTLGLDVKGYAPRDRDRQAANEPSQDASPPKDKSSANPTRSTQERLRAAAVVVRRLISDPAAQARLIERAYDRARGALARSPDAMESEKSGKPSRGRAGR